ncbi:PKD domain-containing protein [Solirubrobacter ginsenosidimutans]|uniref:PKD domain-containing protein n=1 Tax=Solirubrobacter ginsenosidimutans TaxID=490573 RepID=A0A9X3MSK0_9ACTN|nr:PKD domain-containing protein [Solirubrobacter ginsenosidimutans]MDA0158888.1 PKD domain-containing protein [Solirubrobacter ginsenosidimutans]
MEDKRRRLKRRPVLLVLVALIVSAALAIPALGEPTKEVTVDPGAAATASGFTDLDTLTYAQAKDRLDQLSAITLPVQIPGLERLGVANVTLGSNDAGHSLSLSGSADVLGQDVDLLVTAVWPDDSSTTPALAIAAKTDDLSLSRLNPRWDDSYGDVSFATVRLAVAGADQQIDPDALPGAARAFYPEPTDLAGGVNLAGDLQLDGRLADAFGFAGYSGDVHVEGSLAASAAALFGRATDAQLGDLELKATLGKSPTAPAWIADRTSTYVLKLGGGRPSVSADEDITLAVDGTRNHFTGHVAIAPGGDVEAELGLDGPLDAPFGLDASALSDVKLRLTRDAGSLAFTVGGVHVDAAFDGDRADFTAEGPLTATQLADLGGRLLGTPVAAVPGGDAVSLDRVSFSLNRSTFSVSANATVNDLHASALLTLRKQTGAPAKPLLGLRLTDSGCEDCVRLSSLLPAAQLGDTLSGVRLPALDLTATSLTSLSADDLTPQERDFFGAAYPSLPPTLEFSPGLNLEGRLPLDALGYPQGSEATLSGTLGADVTLGSLRSISLRNLALDATLPAPPAGLPTWVQPTGPTTLSFRYASGSVAASLRTDANVTVRGSTFSTTLAGRVARSGARSEIGFSGTIHNWRSPFGAAWLGTLESATVELDTSFGGGRPADVNASVSARQTLAGKRFALDFALAKGPSTTATLTARFLDSARLSDGVRAFGDLSPAGPALPRDMADLTLSDASASVTLGGGSSAFALNATTTFGSHDWYVLVAARPGGGFTAGVKLRGQASLSDLTPAARAMNVRLSSAALVLGSETGSRPASGLTDAEFDFYKSLYGCADGATRTDCTQFARLDVTRGLRLLAGFELGRDVDRMAGAIGIQTRGRALLEGTIPVFGGTDFSLRASLGNFRFDDAPDWFDHGDVALEIGTDGLAFDGDLGVKIQRQGSQWMPACDGGVVKNGKCYDVLDFGVTARAALNPPSLTLTGRLTTERPWRNAFGQNWLQINRLALQLGVAIAPTGPAVTMGFQGDVKIGSKDVAAALKVGLTPAPPPAFVRPDLIGFSAASHAGLALSDLVWLNNQLTGTQLNASNLPDVSLRNLYLQFSQQTDRDLCLTKGVRFSADLYVGRNLPAVEPGADDPSGCRTLDTDPSTRQTCLNRQADGCLASVYGRFDTGGLVAGGEINAFHLGPISLDDTSLALALTPTQQSLSLHGGARIAAGAYEVASGRADLDVSRSGFAFSGDAALFNRTMHGYLKANAALDLHNPSFAVEGWLREDARGAITSAVNPKAEGLRAPIAAFGKVLGVVNGSGSVSNVRDLPVQLRNAGVTVPSQVDTMTRVLGDAQDQTSRYNLGTLTLDRLLNGFSIPISGIPGYWSTCGGVEVDGTCLGIRVDRYCVGTTVVGGDCWVTPPTSISVAGVCSTLHYTGTCSWAGLMRAYVRPALLAAFQTATGLSVSDATFDQALNRLVNGFATAAGSVVNVNCAYFRADASALASGNVNVNLALNASLFGQPLQFGAGWDFRAGGSPDDTFKSIVRTLFSPSSTTCPAFPAGHEQPAAAAGGATLQVAEVPMVDEGDETTVRATFDAMALHYPAVRVLWGDGTASDIAAGEARVVTATHRYAEGGDPVSVYPITVTVQDSGASSKSASGKVRNVAPALTGLAADPASPVEGKPATVAGTFTDPGTTDSHTVQIEWGDGTAAQMIALPAGVLRFVASHRYAQDGPYRTRVTLTDDDGATGRGTGTLIVTNDAPVDVRMKLASGAVAGQAGQYTIDFADAGERDAHTVTVDWADGGPEQTVQLPAGTTRVALQHAYTRAGKYAARVTVADDAGASEQATVVVPVLAGKP